MTQTLGAGILFLFLLLNCAMATAAEKIKVIAGGDNEFPPYEFLDNGEPAGFNIDLLREMATVIGLDIEIQLSPWSTAKRALEQGTVDVLTGMVYSPERAKTLRFSIPHTLIFPCLFVRRDSSIKLPADMHGKEIIVQKDDIMEDYLRKESPSSRIILTANYPEALQLLASGKHDGVLLSSALPRYFIDDRFKLDNLRLVRMDLPPLRYSFAVTAENDTLLYKLDQGLTLLKLTGSYQKIYEKWFGVYEKREWWESIKYFVLALAVVGIAFVGSLLWSRTLKRQVGIQTTELRRSEEKLKRAHDKLEVRVAERTTDLARTNSALESEIYERRKIEEFLRENQEKLRAIIDSFDGQIYICSPDYKIEFMNQKLIERTGHNAIGEPCFSVLHDRDSICPWCVNYQVFDGKTVRWEVQSPKDNRWYYIVNTPIHHTDGTVSKQAMILDITERVQAENEKRRLEAQNLQLQKAESLGRMAGAIAHHFNNMLHVVTGHLELTIQRLSETDSSLPALRAAIQAADQAAEVSRLMLTYIGKVSELSGPIDLAETCKSRLAIIRETLPDNISLYADFHFPGPSVNANAGQMQLVLTNMVNNAREAIGEKAGRIDLAVSTVSPENIPFEHRFPINRQAEDRIYACLEIRDSGCGMAQKNIEEAFDPFFSTKFTGRGLGLSVVLGITQAYGGMIAVESVPEHGSVFRCFLPLSDDVAPSRPKKKIDAADIREKGTVLLVDDDKIVLIITRQMLETLGFNVISAMNGPDAVEIFRRNHDQIRFVLSDFSMPGMNGLEVLNSLRNIVPEIPMIIASGYNEEKVMDPSLPERPQAFLGKPFGSQELKNVIYAILGNM